MTGKHARALVIGVLVSLLALYLAFKDVNVPALIGSIASADPAWVLVVLLAYMVHYWLKALRWRDLLEPVYRARTGEAFPVMMIGFFANNFLPAHLGEFVRMYVGSRLFRVSNTGVLATIVLERVFDFSVVALMFGLALIGGGSISGHIVYAGYALIAITVSAFIILYLILRFEKHAFRLAGYLLRPFPAALRDRITQMLRLVLSAMQSMKSARVVIRIVVLSLLQWLLVGLAIYGALRSVGVEISAAAATITLASTVLAVTLPAAPGFFGTIQLAFLLALAPYGVSETDALAGSVVFHVTSYFLVMISGVTALQQLNMGFSDLRREVDKV